MAKCTKAYPQDSIDFVSFDSFNLIRVGDFRSAEYTQTTQTKVNEFEYALGNKVIKAFATSDCKFYYAKGHLMMLHTLDGLAETPQKRRITFMIQKKKEWEEIIFAADDKHQHICLVWWA